MCFPVCIVAAGLRHERRALSVMGSSAVVVRMGVLNVLTSSSGLIHL